MTEIKKYCCVEELEAEFGFLWHLQSVEGGERYVFQCDLEDNSDYIVRYYPMENIFYLYTLNKTIITSMYDWRWVKAKSEDEVHKFIKMNTKLKNFK